MRTKYLDAKVVILVLLSTSMCVTVSAYAWGNGWNSTNSSSVQDDTGSGGQFKSVAFSNERLTTMSVQEDFSNLVKTAQNIIDPPAGSQQITFLNPILGNELDGWSLTYTGQILNPAMTLYAVDNVQINNGKQTVENAMRIKDSNGNEGWVSSSDVWAKVALVNVNGQNAVFALTRADNIGLKEDGKALGLFYPTVPANGSIKSLSIPGETGKDLGIAGLAYAFVTGGTKAVATAEGTKTLTNLIVRADQIGKADSTNQSGAQFLELDIFVPDYSSICINGRCSEASTTYDMSAKSLGTPKEETFLKVVDSTLTPALIKVSDVSLVSGIDKVEVTNNGNTLYVSSNALIYENSEAYEEAGFPPLGLI